LRAFSIRPAWCWRGVSAPATVLRWFDEVPGSQKHQEGNGAGDGERLRERNNALKGEPQERIWHEIGPADSGRKKASRG
jgi:hypothetical protein